MNDHIHPTMQQALAGIVPPGFRSAPVMHATQHLQSINEAQRAALASFDAPRCPAGQFLHVHKHPTLGALDCHLEWEDAAPECGWAEQVTLCAAYMCGRDIYGRLTPSEVEAIEIEATRQPKQAVEPA